MNLWMRRICVLLLLLCVCLPVATIGGAATGATIGPSVEQTTGEQTVVVRLTEQPSAAIRATDHENRIGTMQAHATTTQSPFERFAEGNPHVEINRSFWITNALVVTVDTDRIPLQRLGTVDNVERIHENYNLSLATTAGSTATSHPQRSDTQTGTQQPAVQQPVAPQLESTTTRTTDGLAQINVADAWEYTKGGGTSIAVLDTGVDPTHPDIDIDPANWNDWDTEGNPRDTTPQAYGRHGTHVSGTAVGGDASGTHIGVAPKAELYHGAALNQNCDPRCGGTVAQLYAGMEWAVEQDVDVISMSLGGVDKSDDFIDELVPAVKNAQDAGTVVVAAAGNKPIDTTISPGNIYGSISVGATTADGTIADLSSSDTISATDWDDPPADWPETYTVPTVAAPGINIYSSFPGDPGDRYGRLDGTSMATPHVSGTVALIQAASSESLSPDEIRSILESTAVDTGDPQTRQGAGQIDAGEAVQTVVPPANFAVDITSVTNPTTAGKQLTVNYTIENTGGKSDSQRVVLKLDDAKIHESIVTLDSGDPGNKRFSYQTTTADVGAQTFTITSENDSASRTIDFVEPTVRLANTTLEPDSVTTGSTNSYTLTADVYNVSDDGQNETVTISLPTALTLTDPINTTDVTTTDTDDKTVDVAVKNADDNTITLSLSPETDAELRDLTLTVNFTARTNSLATVDITNTSLEPDSVTSGSTNSYTLTADVYNVSDDDQAETVTISLPSALTLTSTVKALEATATDTDGEPVDVAVENADDNNITLSMSPDTGATLRDLTLTIEFTAKATTAG